ncbi:glycosyltransferase family 4 protein [Candidatus Woesearchaeota archaeon]|nr:glycosyltransferase family 4 protein [Candidatus Woesearchaeota archaeon]
MDKGIKICFVSTFAYPLFNPKCKRTFGGSEVQMYLIAKELAKDKKFDVNFIVADFGQRKTEKYFDVKVHKSYPVAKKIINYIRGPFVLYKVLRKINPDFVIQRSAAPETGICAFYCKKYNKKFIYSIAHEIDINGEFAAKGIFGKMYNYGLNRTDYIIAQNYGQIKLLNRWKNKIIRNIKVVKSGYEIETMKIKVKEFVLWIGRSDKWKRPDIFLDLAEDFPYEKFIMVLPKSSQKKFWKNVSKRAKNIENVEFFENVSFNKINEYFKKAKVFVNTSKYEGFPNTFVQAAKNKTPILSLNVNPDNFLNKYKCGFVCNDNFNLMKNKLDLLLKNKRIYNAFSKNAFDYAKKKHNIKKIIKYWKEVIKNVSIKKRN